MHCAERRIWTFATQSILPECLSGSASSPCLVASLRGPAGERTLAGYKPGPGRRLGKDAVFDVCRMTGDAGIIAPGAFAELVAVSGDPLDQLEILKSPQAVFKEGERIV